MNKKEHVYTNFLTSKIADINKELIPFGVYLGGREDAYRDTWDNYIKGSKNIENHKKWIKEQIAYSSQGKYSFEDNSVYVYHLKYILTMLEKFEEFENKNQERWYPSCRN